MHLSLSPATHCPARAVSGQLRPGVQIDTQRPARATLEMADLLHQSRPNRPFADGFPCLYLAKCCTAALTPIQRYSSPHRIENPSATLIPTACQRQPGQRRTGRALACIAPALTARRAEHGGFGSNHCFCHRCASLSKPGSDCGRSSACQGRSGAGGALFSRRAARSLGPQTGAGDHAGTPPASAQCAGRRWCHGRCPDRPRQA